ncbi:RHS repeat domain-containing protein, partial [Anaeromassilibacillus sp. An200]|uniref:RHS repeat domain-containing protein n=1 Tax=Anaeromassilibacillus sp. An200 TaxID=1965587 RepID=UPI001122877B
EEELYRYDPRNRLMAYTKNGVTTMFQYDNAGNLLVDDKVQYSYDAFNRTVKAEAFDGNVQVNRYDAEGLRYEMEENGRLVRFIFHKGEAVAEQEENSNVIRLIRGSELIARSSDGESARTYYHYASDEMGSTTHIVDDNGNVQNRYAYDAWGKITVREEAVPNRFTYYGQQIDPITQQYYLRARFYNPIIGRFTQEDTYRGDGLNLYAYCANNPVFYVDLSGFYKDGLDAATRRQIRKYADSIRKKTNVINELQEEIYTKVLNGIPVTAEDMYGLAYLKYGKSVRGHILLDVVSATDTSGKQSIIFADVFASGRNPFKNKKVSTSTVMSQIELSDLNLHKIEQEIAITGGSGNTHTEPKALAMNEAILKKIDERGGLNNIKYSLAGYQEPCLNYCRPRLRGVVGDKKGKIVIEYTGELDETFWEFNYDLSKEKVEQRFRHMNDTEATSKLYPLKHYDI